MKGLLLALAMVLASAAGARAEPSPPQPDVKPFAMARSVQMDVTSKVNGRTYRIYVHTPLLPPPPGGYPVLYVTDGNGTFPVAAGQSDILALTGGRTLVVGIGYPTDDLATTQSRRNLDLTPSRPIGTLPGRPDAKAGDYGDAESFYRFIVEEVRPLVAGMAKVDPKDQTLYGHSLGGLFTLHVLFRHPDSFKSFVASSPSIWWNEREVLKEEGALATAVEAHEVAPRVLIEVGALEATVPTHLPPGTSEATARADTEHVRMVGNVRDLAAQLAKLKGGPGYEVRSQVFEEEDHLSVMAASMSRALLFADPKSRL